MARKTTSKIERDCQAMIKAASVMPHQQGIDHVTEQARLIFDQNHDLLTVAELELSEARKESDRISKELEKLRRELQKYPDQTVSAPAQNEEKDGE